MKKFYSILKVSPNIATEDSVAIGIILFDGKKLYSYFSERKKRLTLSLLDEKNINLNFITNQIEEKCNEINLENEKRMLFHKFEKLTDISYFDYLASYSNGIIQFSKPKALLDDINKETFHKLVKLFFNDLLIEEVMTRVDKKLLKVQETISKKLIDKVEQKVHVHYKFNSKVFPTIYFPYEMDCIGLNGSLIGAKSLSFSKSLTLIDKNISHYFALISSLSSKFNKNLKENNFYLIAEEPEKIGSKEHQLWESVRLNELINVIHPEESNIVAEEILNKKAGKFLIE